MPTPALARLDRFPVLVHAYMFLCSLSLGCLIPLYSTYIITELGEPAWKLALYIVSAALITLAANRFFGARIDGGSRLRAILLLCLSLYIFNMALQTSIPTYAMLLLGAPLMGVSGANLSASFSFSRLFAEQTGRDPAKFNAHVRMAMSMGWIVGPPMAFMLYDWYGALSIFPTSGAVAVLALGLCLATIPANFVTHHPAASKSTRHIEPVPLPMFLACIPLFFLNMGNTVFISAGPVFFIEELGLPTSTPGIGFSVKCLFEIIAIYLVVKPAQKIGEKNMLLVAALLGTLFFASIVQVTAPAHVYLLCMLEGIYYGINVGIGLTFIQAYAPHRPGIASAYYVNSIFAGSLMGNLVTGGVGSFTTFQNTILSSAGVTLLAALVLLMIRSPHQVIPQQACVKKAKSHC